MCSRAFAFVLALFMLWLHPAAQPQAFAVALSAPAAGSVETARQAPPYADAAAEHDRKDTLPTPGQAHAEAAFDAQEMLPEAAATALAGPRTGWPNPHPALAPAGPYLDALQRPPSAGLRLA